HRPDSQRIYIECAGLGISGGQQVGSACCPATAGLLPATDAVNPAQVNTCGRPRYVHALLWSGSASNVVDLHPSGFVNSEATGTSGSQQVGDGFGAPISNLRHALLWSGTAASVVDLHPSGFAQTVGTGISGNQQVGYGFGPATRFDHH